MNSDEKKPAQIHRTPKQIEMLVEQFHRSGQRVEDFAQQHGVVVSTVNRWLRKHRRRKVPRLVEVDRVPNPSSSSRAATFRFPRGLVLELEGGFDAPSIARLVQLLEER